jgi:predicted aspartyl protease
METDTMGRVLTEATIENLGDLLDVEQGRISPEQVRRVVLTDALVDTGAAMLSMPIRYIQQLGLKKRYTKRVTDSRGGVGAVNVYGTVRLTIQGRDCPTDVLEVPDNVPVLVGQIPLEYLDLVVDMRNHCLIGNPAHGGEHMFDMY